MGVVVIKVSNLVTNKLLIPLMFLLSFISISQTALAHCPLCAAATGAAVATARWYGVDDLITGTFIGGLILSTTVWFNNILRKKNRQKDYIPQQYLILILASISLTVLTFYFTGLFGSSNPNFIIQGIDKLLIGFLVGSIITLSIFQFHDKLREFNGNKNFMPFQVIILTLVFLSIASFSYYLIGWV